MTQSELESSSHTRQISGRLHVVEELRDKAGNLVSTVTRPLKVDFQLTDFVQLIAGATVMALPVALTEEVWDLAAELSPGRSLLILAISLATLSAFIWALFYGKHLPDYPKEFVTRCVSAYRVTFLVSLLLLALFDKAPLDDLGLAFKRAVLVAFPASFAATAVDFMK